jgi:hypothetical protein
LGLLNDDLAFAAFFPAAAGGLDRDIQGPGHLQQGLPAIAPGFFPGRMKDYQIHIFS